ncbi:MAG: sigma-E processing peptidase SpoIIGA [Oscillospiraceae bacterium]|nr:sigma-E processing peptidase SpoIIGA [Oscillospiraceae bacterium]
MTVYVDLLFGLNMAINYLLLRGSAALGGCPAVTWRLLAAAAVGGLYAVSAVVPQLQALRSGLWQGLCAGIMLLMAFGFQKNTVKQGLFFFALSFAFGGVVLLLVQAVEPACVLLGGHAYYAVSMPALLLLAGACYGISAMVLKGCGTHTGGDVVSITLFTEQGSLPLRALRDTGNTLRDPIGGQPVMIVDGKTLLRLFPQADLAKISFQDPAEAMGQLALAYPKCRFRLLPYRAVGVQSGLLLAVRCRGRIGKKVQPILAAFSPEALGCGETFDALWGGAVS